jgi:hypothetical protein
MPLPPGYTEETDQQPSGLPEGYSIETENNLPAGYTLDEGKPDTVTKVAKPSVYPEYNSAIPETGIKPVDAMVQPFGEVAANLKEDPKFRSDTEKYGAGSAAVAGSAVAAVPIAEAGAAMVAIPGKVWQAIRDVAKGHPLLTRILADTALIGGNAAADRKK